MKKIHSIHSVKVSLTIAELNERLLIQWGSEEKIRDHYAAVSKDMEGDFTAPVIDYCIRIEDREGSVLIQNFSNEANEDPQIKQRQYFGVPVCILFSYHNLSSDFLTRYLSAAMFP